MEVIAIFVGILIFGCLCFGIGVINEKDKNIKEPELIEFTKCIEIMDFLINSEIKGFLQTLDMNNVVKIPDNVLKDKIAEINTDVASKMSEQVFISLTFYLSETGISNLLNNTVKNYMLDFCKSYHEVTLK